MPNTPSSRPAPRKTARAAVAAGRRETFVEYIMRRMKELKFTQTELCARADISRQTFHTLVHAPTKMPALQTLFGLADALQVHPIRLVQLLCDDRVAIGVSPARPARGDKTSFIRDVTYPDGVMVLPGERFTKVWESQNTGTVPWENRFLQCMDEEIVVYANSGETLRVAQPLKPDARRVAIPYTAPGEIVQIAVTFTAPREPGTVLSYWKSVHADGRLCFPNAQGVWVKVRVVSMAEVSSGAEGAG